MEYKENIYNFVFYNYQNPTKNGCIKRIVSLWIAFGVYTYVSKLNYWIIWMAAGIYAAVSGILLVLRYKYNYRKWAGFLSDGIFCYTISISLNYIVYRNFNFLNSFSIFVLGLHFGLLHLFILLMFLLIKKNICQNKYLNEEKNRGSGVISAVFSLMGIVAAQTVMAVGGRSAVYWLVGFSLTILSYLIGIGSVNIYRAYLCYHFIEKQDNKKSHSL